MKRPLTDAEANHLRRLLGWVACEIGQEPAEMVETVRKIAPAIGHDISDEAKSRLVQAHHESANVPKYVRAAVNALRKTMAQTVGDIVDAEAQEVREIGTPTANFPSGSMGEYVEGE